MLGTEGALGPANPSQLRGKAPFCEQRTNHTAGQGALILLAAERDTGRRPPPKLEVNPDTASHFPTAGSWTPQH